MLQTLSQTLAGLLEAADQLEHNAPTKSELDAVIARGEFRPSEDEAIGFWFARFLSIREHLWSVIDDVLEVLNSSVESTERTSELQFFALGYAAVCIVVRLDRLVLFDVGHHSIVQRKLNEAFPEYRIPRKQYTEIFSAFVDHKNVLAIRDAMIFCRKNRRQLSMLDQDPCVGFVVRQLPGLEASLNPSKRSYIRRSWAYVSHKWRRRGVVTTKNVLATVLEAIGRTASEFVQMENKRVSKEVLDSIATFLKPGDVIITRHAKALTNLFIPGFWPHAALYVGQTSQSTDGRSVLEARKDGVRYRPLNDTLSVDAFVVLRPKLDSQSIQDAIERAFLHEGKMYNFDFDFFNSDRIVCTELIYRAYDGLDDLQIPLNDRAGRKVLTAENLLDFSLESHAFEPVAIFGVARSENAVTYGADVRELLIASYDSTSSL